MKNKFAVLLAVLSFATFPATSLAKDAIAQPEAPMAPEKIGAPTEAYDKILENSKPVAGALQVEADAALGSGRYNRAIELARRSIKRDGNDLDSHRVLAEGLDMKYEQDPAHDLSVLRECLIEYLIVMNAQVGEEKGVSFLGPGIMAKLYGDDDNERYALAKQRIKALTGSLPRPWESNAKFLARVVKPEVHARLLNSQVQSKQLN